MKLKKLITSLMHGKLLLALGVERFLPEIVFAFVMILVAIGVNIKIDSTLKQAQENKLVLMNLQSVHTATQCRLTGLDCASRVEDMLQDMGSNVAIPRKRAITPRRLSQMSAAKAEEAKEAEKAEKARQKAEEAKEAAKAKKEAEKTDNGNKERK